MGIKQIHTPMNQNRKLKRLFGGVFVFRESDITTALFITQHSLAQTR